MIARRRHHRLREAAAERALAELEATPTAAGQATANSADGAPGDPEFAPELAAMRRLTHLLEQVPAEAWAAIPAADVAAGTRARAWRRLSRPVGVSRGLVTAAAVACLAIGFLAGALIAGSGTSSPGAGTGRGPAVVLRPLISSPAGSQAVAYMPGAGQMVLRVSYLPPSRADTYYELWLMTDLHHLAPVAAFQVGAGGRAQLDLRLPADPSRYQYLDISLQQLGAGTGHSGDSVLRGRLA